MVYVFAIHMFIRMCTHSLMLSSIHIFKFVRVCNATLFGPWTPDDKLKCPSLVDFSLSS